MFLRLMMVSTSTRFRYKWKGKLRKERFSKKYINTTLIKATKFSTRIRIIQILLQSINHVISNNISHRNNAVLIYNDLKLNLMKVKINLAHILDLSIICRRP